MLAVFLVYDPHHFDKYCQCLTCVQQCMPDAYLFILQKVGENTCSLGALFNAGIQFAGLGRSATICCINTYEQWNPKVMNFRSFVEFNGFHNRLEHITLDLQTPTDDGFRENRGTLISTNFISKKCIFFQIDMPSLQSNQTEYDPYLIHPVRC